MRSRFSSADSAQTPDADETGVPIAGVKCDSSATYACHSERLSLSLSLTVMWRSQRKDVPALPASESVAKRLQQTKEINK